MTVRIGGSSGNSRRPWVQKPWRSSKRVVRRVKVIGRCGCTLREATWALRWGSMKWWEVKIIIVVSVIVVRVSSRWCAIGWLRSPCGRRCVVRRIFVQRRMPSSERSPIDDAFALDLVDGVRWYFGFIVFGILGMVVSIASEKVVITVWVVGECDHHQSPQCVACRESHVFWCDVSRSAWWRA